MPRITPFLWFDTQAEEAANFYVSVFPNSRVGRIARYSDAGPGVPGAVMTVEFDLDGQTFVALNGGPHFQFNEAVSFEIPCETQSEVDAYWGKLTSGGGKPVQCGWLKDRFGVSWQVVPTVLPRLMADPDRARAARVAAAMLQMVKLDIAALEKAAAG